MIVSFPSQTTSQIYNNTLQMTVISLLKVQPSPHQPPSLFLIRPGPEMKEIDLSVWYPQECTCIDCGCRSCQSSQPRGDPQMHSTNSTMQETIQTLQICYSLFLLSEPLWLANGKCSGCEESYSLWITSQRNNIHSELQMQHCLTSVSIYNFEETKGLKERLSKQA